MKGMQQLAELVISSYDLNKIEKSFSTILSSSNTVNITIKGKPSTYKITKTKNTPIIWGCEGLNVKRRSVFVTGSQDDLKRLVRVKTIGGVYVQLLPQQ